VDVILLDQRLPTARAPCGRRAARDPPGAKVILVTGRWTQASSTRPWPPVARLRHQGDSIDALSAAVREPAGGHAVSPAMLTADERRPNGSSLTEPLTPRETAVLLFLADGLATKRSAGALHQHSHAPQPHQSIISSSGHSKLEAVSIASARPDHRTGQRLLRVTE